MAKKQKHKIVREKPLYAKIITVILILVFVSTLVVSVVAGING